MAAGEGKRMHSPLAKVLHKAAGVPLVRRAMAAAAVNGAEQPVVIVGHMAEAVKAELAGDARFALQARQLGTGHAVMCAEEYLTGREGYALVLAGDMPLLQRSTVQKLVDYTKAQGNAVTLLSAILPDATGYGRILREGDAITGIVEHRDATEEQRQIKEVNASVYCFEIGALLTALHGLKNDNAQGEYYLTDCVAAILAMGKKAGALVAEDAAECMGVNTPEQLAQCEAILLARENG